MEGPSVAIRDVGLAARCPEARVVCCMRRAATMACRARTGVPQSFPRIPMESIYYVMAWACHRKCRHCYEDRFRPYIRGELESVVAEAERNYPRIVDHLPARMTYRDLDAMAPDGTR